MRKSILTLLALLTATMAVAQAPVYFTNEISAESLQKIYEALGVPATGRVAVKISTGESQNSNQLKPELIRDFVNGIDGTTVAINAKSLSGLKPGLYIINGEKRVIK